MTGGFFFSSSMLLLCFQKTEKRRRRRPILFFWKARRSILPDDLIVKEILTRLPSKKVARLRTVCKQWNSLTSTQYFIDMHANMNQLLIRARGSEADINSFSFVVDYNTPDLMSKRDCCQFLSFNQEELELAAAAGGSDAKKKRIRTTKKKKIFELSTVQGERIWLRQTNTYAKPYLISYSHNGFLVYLVTSHNTTDLILYNPVTAEQVTVMAPNWFRLPTLRMIYCGYYCLFSPTNKEGRVLYKVFDHDDVRFEVLDIQTRSLRKINNNNNNNFSVRYHLDRFPVPAPVISNGALHWMVSETRKHKLEDFGGLVQSCSEAILSFGMESEEFRFMPHPGNECGGGTCGGGGGDHKMMSLLEIEAGQQLCWCDGSYCSNNNGSGNNSMELHLWVIEDYNKWTWVKKHVVLLSPFLMSNDRPRPNYGREIKALQIYHGELLLEWFFEGVNYPRERQYWLYRLNNIIMLKNKEKKKNFQKHYYFEQPIFDLKEEGVEAMIFHEHYYPNDDHSDVLMMRRILITTLRKRGPWNMFGKVVIVPHTSVWWHNIKKPPCSVLILYHRQLAADGYNFGPKFPSKLPQSDDHHTLATYDHEQRATAYEKWTFN